MCIRDRTEPGKSEKGPGTRKGRPAKADKAALDKSPAPGVLDKVSRGGKKDKGKETGSGGAGPGVKVPKGKAAPVKEAAAPPPEIHLPPTPEVPPRPVEQGKIVYLKLSELHPFHTLRDHPFKVQDDKAMDDLVGTIKEHGIMTPATDVYKRQILQRGNKPRQGDMALNLFHAHAVTFCDNLIGTLIHVC